MNQYKSNAQKKKFLELYSGGKITKEVYQEWEANSKGKPLPSKLAPKKSNKMKHKQY